MQILHCLVLVNLFAACSATNFCGGCRPMQYQVSPGIGLDFGMDYGTASIQYPNGTLLDVTKVDASPSYRATMLQFADDALKYERGEDQTVPHFTFRHDCRFLQYDPNWTEPWALNRIDLKQKFMDFFPRIFRSLLPAASHSHTVAFPEPDRWTQPLLDMTTALLSHASEIVPEAERVVSFTYPDSLRRSGRLVSRLRHAIHLAGYDVGGSYNMPSSFLAAQRLGIAPFSGNLNVPHDADDPSRGLIITLSDTSALLADVQMDNTRFPDVLKTAIFTRSSRTTNNQHRRVEELVAILRDFASSPTLQQSLAAFDEILLLGDQAGSPELQQAIELVLEGKSQAADNGNRIRTLDAAEQQYAGARAAADMCRLGLETAFNGCLPNDWCPEAVATERESARDEL